MREIVRERSLLRQLIRVGNEIAASAFNTEGRKARELVDEAERRVFEIAEAGIARRGGFVKVSASLLASGRSHRSMLHQQPRATHAACRPASARLRSR